MKNTLETTRHSSLVQVCAAHDTLFSQMEAIADQIYLSDSFHKFELEKTPEKALGIIEELNILNQTCSYLDEIVFHFAGDPYLYSGAGSNTVNNFMSCHRFNLIRCHKSAHFPVMLSIAYTIVLSYLFASSQDSVSQAAA